jgi:subtilisin-like proprotein convertase family protein
MPRVRSIIASLAAALLFASILPVAAPAAGNPTFSFLDSEPLFPAGETVGPANIYPASFTVAGLAGTVTKVTVTAIELNASDDLDMALVGPNGAQVMLMSDACGVESAANEIWTFDDEAPQFVSAGTCTGNIRASFRPTNYEVGTDNFGAGGPSGEFSTHLSSFNGISPDGTWKLFMIDDSAIEIGFAVRSVSLNLEVEPPAPPAPATIVEKVLVPGPTVTVPAPSAPKGTAAKTGKRAAALAKCAKKKSKDARAKCRAKARKLPV